MTTKNDTLGIDLWGFNKAPKWQRIFIASLFFAGAVGGAISLIESHLGSPESRVHKTKLEPLAEQLLKAQKMGDKSTALALAEPTLQIVNEFNALDASQKSSINNSSLRYCILAAVHLASGPIEVIETGQWVSKSKYDAAFDECK